MGRPYDVLTFDCYGTLIDWESGIGRWFEEAAAADGAAMAPSNALAAYAEIEPAVEAKAYRSYREVLTATALRVANRLGWSLAPERARTLSESLPSWQPFPDTNSALERLAMAGYSLGILSNVDDDLLSSTLSHFTVRFDLLITAQQVRSYKPALRHFHAAREQIGKNRRWLHAAQSLFHDIVPAHALGIPVAWVNRKGQAGRPDILPDIEVKTLGGLADRLDRLGA
jgi:2-haloalkanoic acid dehalogenase type II